MDVSPLLVADGQTTEARQPGQGPLHNPPVPSQPGTGIDPLPCDAHPDVALVQRLPASRIVIPLIGMELGRTLASPAIRLPDERDRVEQGFADGRVMAVGPGQERGKRDAGSVDHKVTLRARYPLGLAPIRWIRPGCVAPFCAGMLAESSEARLQSIWPASPSRSSKARWSASHTPASCQSRNRRQQVMPEPQPISRGSISQGMPDLSTKIIPFSAARSEIRGRPPLGLGGSGGSSGATRAQSSSLTSGLAILQVCHASPGFVRCS